MAFLGRTVGVWGLGCALVVGSAGHAAESALVLDAEEVIVDGSTYALDASCECVSGEECIEPCATKPRLFAKLKETPAKLSCWNGPRFPRWRGLHRSAGACETVCNDSCDACFCSNEWECCGEVAEVIAEEPVESTALPCPSCGHVIAPSPAAPKPAPSAPATPVTETPRSIPGNLRPGPTPTDEESPPLPSKDPTSEKEGLVPVPAEQGIEPMKAEMMIPTPGNAPDFSWIQGEIQRVHVKGGVWVVRYLPLDQTDANGGSVVILDGRPLSGIAEGELVRLEGEISRAKTGLTFGGPAYRVRKVTRLEQIEPAN